MIREFTLIMNPNEAKTHRPPLLKQNRLYKVIDIRVNALLQNGDIKENLGTQALTILIDEIKILDKVVGAVNSGKIASFALNQYLQAFSQLEIELTEIPVTSPPTNIEKMLITFIIEDDETEAEERRKEELKKAKQ